MNINELRYTNINEIIIKGVCNNRCRSTESSRKETMMLCRELGTLETEVYMDGISSES